MEKRKLDIAFGMLAVLSALLLFNQVAMMFSFRLDMAGLEDCMAYYALQLGSGNIYSDPETYPYLVLQYPPLYYSLTAWLSIPLDWMLNDQVRAVYLAGRAISVAGVVCSLYVVYYTFHKVLAYPVRYALIPAMLGLLLFTTHMFAVRPDGLKAGLIMLMYALVLIRFRKKDKWVMVALILVSASALLAKQDALVHWGAVFLILGLNDRRKDAVVWLISSMTVVVVVLLISFDFDLQLIYKNLVLGIAQGFDPVWTKALVLRNIPLLSVILLWTIYLFVHLYRSEKYGWIPSLMLVYIGVHLALFKWGANVNYLVEFQFLLVASLMVIYYSHGRKAALYLSLAGTLIILVNNLDQRNIMFFNPWYERGAKQVYRDQKETAGQLSTALDKSDCTDIILFDTKLTIFMHETTVLGTLFNEYPDLQEDVHMVSQTIPDRVFRYRLKCDLAAGHQQCLLVPAFDYERQRGYLMEIFRNGPAIDLDKKEFSLDGWELYTLNCKQ